MKIILMNTPMENSLKMERDDDFFEGYGYYPPLGLLYLESYLNKHFPCEVKIIDCLVNKINYENLKEIIYSQQPDIVGITSFTSVMVDLIQTAAIVKEASPDTKIVVGGVHATIYPKETALLKDIDYVVIGDGEEIFTELIQSLSSGTDLRKIRGLTFKKKNKLFFTEARPYNKDLDSLPFPNRKKIPFQKYTCTIGSERIMTTMISSRGCPYKCTFCNSPEKSYRMRSPENIISEMKEIATLGIKEILFFDDLFNINKKRVLEICNLIKKNALSLKWSFRGRIQGIDYQLAEHLKDTGCERIQFGIETGNDEELRLLKKQLRVSEIKDVIKICKEAGITTSGSFMIGLPGDTKERIIKRFQFAESIGLDYVQYAVLIPYPYTEIYREGLRQGIFKENIWLKYAKNPTNTITPPIWEENLKRNELYRLLYAGFRSFYLRPGFIIKTISGLKSFGELMKKMRGMLSIVR